MRDDFERAERDILRFVRKILISVVLIIASPFLMLAFLFFLLERPLAWSLIPLTIALLLYTAAAVVWLVVRWRVRRARRDILRVTDNVFLRPPS